MAVISLFDNATGSWSRGTGAGALIESTPFKCNEEGAITDLGWYRFQTGAGEAPTTLTLWDTTNTTNYVWRTTSVSDNGAVGWQWSPIDPPVDPVVGREYRVAAYWSSNYRSISRTSGEGTPPAQLSFVPANRRYGRIDNTDAYPNFSEQGIVNAIDIRFNTSPPTPTPAATAADVENALVRWFDSGEDNTRTGELPWLTHALTTAIQAGVDEATEMLEDLVAIGIAVKLGDAQAAIDAVKETIEDFGVSGDPSHAGLRADIQGAGNPTIADVMGAIAALPTDGGGLTPLYDGSGDWTQAAQTVGQGSFDWVQPADAYVIHVEDMAESGRTARAVGTEEIYWLRGWAKPWDGTRWGPEHIIVNGLTQVVQGVRRWGGIGFWLPPDVEWTITAHDYTPE